MAHIFQINLSNGGLPKHGLHQAVVNNLGLVGDEQRDHVHHGGPERALCLYSLERLLSLQAEGHPVFAGAMGENLTLSGLDWEQVTPGSQLQVGEVVVEVASYTVPCGHLKPYFMGNDISRVSQETHPGWSRVYARVLHTGIVKVGDAVKVI
jgi:MOSC domain-containing protein YiiM